MNFLVYMYICLVFSVCLILFHFILFLSNFTPFGRVVLFLASCLLGSCCRRLVPVGSRFLIKVEFEPNGTGTVRSACGRG